jgi:hypothetical protein
VAELDAILEFHRSIRSALDAQEATVAEREAAAQKTLAECRMERQKIESERATLDSAEKLYIRASGKEPEVHLVRVNMLAGFEVASAETRSIGQERARVGPQRYAMLVVLRDMREDRSLEDIAGPTGLSIKRIRGQMNTEVERGTVTERDGRYTITDSGRELLIRFAEYRRERGIPLPTLADVATEDTDEGEADEPVTPNDSVGSYQ